jgi:hypothetical protein
MGIKFSVSGGTDINPESIISTSKNMVGNPGFQPQSDVIEDV